MQLQEFLTYFKVAHRNQDGVFQCNCPAHPDKKASLSIAERDGKILWHCHADCEAEDVIKAVGLSYSDIFGNREQERPTWLERLGKNKRIEAIYDYTTGTGEYLYSKVRFAGKEIRYITVDQTSDSYKYGKNGPGTLYRLPELLKAIKDGKPVYIAEGEKDVETLRKLGYTATTAGGVSDWRKSFAEYFKDADVIVLPDHDEPGQKTGAKIVKDLKPYARSIKSVITSKADHGDVTDYLQEGHTKADLDALVSAAEELQQKSEAPATENKYIKAVTAAELEEIDIPPIEWLVNSILPVGLSIIGAPSKYFKSYMALGLCVSICNGTKFLGFDTNKHACLYLDLESTKRRPKVRLKQILKNEPLPKNLYIITGEDGVGQISKGFEEQIEHQLKEHPEIKLVIVDVFQMIRQPAKHNQLAYDRDYADFKVLKQIADTYSIGLMLIHHTRKMGDPSDPFNELSGSTGMLGAMDCAWMLKKQKRTDDEATLHITGRDLESAELKVEFNKKTFIWEYIGTAEEVENQRFVDEYHSSPIIKTIKKLVETNDGSWSGSASEIKNASQYFNIWISDDVGQIGKKINKFKALLELEGGIAFEDERSAGKKRERIKRFFSVRSVRSDSAVRSDSTVRQIELTDI